jgi:C4-dicarboxylate transporter, DctQ subunit
MSNFVRKLNKFEEGLVAFSLLAIALLTFVETVLRYTISFTFPWFQELANYTIIFATFLGASIGVKYGVHFSMEALPQTFPDRASHVLKAAAYFLSGVVVALFVWYGFTHALSLKSFEVRSSAMQMPMYIPYLPIPVFSLTMAFRFFALSFKHARGFVKHEPFERVLRKD